ncbi:Enoyl-CoA hydratase/carnithine racemase [Nannocystis exedens]|uniref:Enoyl-CoA hydratase/carnithine racemase n=1 Tax=Nannocystis exedens TaxID=54 RepID=A0A1I1Z5V2_9BACT|nr:enoyl-CoA hydratase-related protein [Nannocystis exedens]PCC75203.1 3-hydroxyacyl-CoA dehydrogenase [Nannocystis exedens]SFE25730.1 Enoyl-CoA hydratase/carnithine racemase [Nannocystis exedens]
MENARDPSVAAIFQPDGGPPRALLVAGCCGNVGFGKLGQLARILARHGVPVIALDLSPAVDQVAARLAEQFAPRVSPAEIEAITRAIIPIRGGIADIPAELKIGLVFEAVPESLAVKKPLYAAIRARDPEALIFSATSGFTTRHLFDGLEGADRCGVLHPFFPHLTNKLWELPEQGAVTGAATLKQIKAFLGRAGMTLISVGDVPSFAADRLFCGMMLEAVRIHESTGLTPAQIDDACKQLLGTSPFFVHNLIRGANGLSAHCMELMREEVDSTLYAIPDAWKPYIADPGKQWPYERGQKCPPEGLAVVRARMFGMLFALTARMLAHKIVAADALNYLAEKALAFRDGPPALIAALGLEQAAALTRAFLVEQRITRADEVAPLDVFSRTGLGEHVGWDSIYVGRSVSGGVGLLSLKRSTLGHTLLAEFGRAVDALQADPAVEAIVVAPDGHYNRDFGHGADIGAFVPVLGKRDAALALIQGWKAALAKLRAGKPTVAAIVGRALGGGMELASSCHARIAGDGAVIAQPEPTVGVIPGLGGCHLLHRSSAPEHYAALNELLLTGKSINAARARELGLVSAVVPVRDLPRASGEYALALARGTAPLPPFRTGPAEVAVDRDVDPRNEQGVVLDAELRDLLARTIQDANALDVDAASALEEQRAADSLCQSAARVGVTAMSRGKPPVFEHPLA